LAGDQCETVMMAERATRQVKMMRKARNLQNFWSLKLDH